MSKRYCPRCETELRFETLRVMGFCPKCDWSGGPNEFVTEFKPNIVDHVKTNWIPYVSIDLETTGLDPNECQILEFGAVIDDWHTPVENLPQFHCYVLPRHTIRGQAYLIGTPYALTLNAETLKKLASNNIEAETCHEENLGPQFADWLIQHKVDPLHIMAAGKNFASFDLQFLNSVPHFSDSINFKYQSIDPAIFYWQPNIDSCLPNTAECLKRAGFDSHVAHTAIKDCISIIRLIRRGVRKCQLIASG